MAPGLPILHQGFYLMRMCGEVRGVPERLVGPSHAPSPPHAWGRSVSACVHAQSCLTLCNPMDCSLPGSSVHGILQARLLEWVAISFSRGIFLTQGSNTGLLHRREILYHLCAVYLVAQSCLTFCDPMDCSTPGLPVHHQLPEFTQTHAH